MMISMNQSALTAALRKAEKDPQQLERIIEDPQKELGARHPLQTSEEIYKMVIRFLGAISIIALIGYLGLSALGMAIPDAVLIFGSAALGGLTGLLSPSPQTT